MSERQSSADRKFAIEAYTERQAMDPQTGEDGILREEYRFVPYRESDQDDRQRCIEAWGPDWRRYRPFASIIIEHRYIRRGTVEAWTPWQAANDRQQALGELPDGLESVSKGYTKLQAERGQAQAIARQERQAAEDAQQERSERRERRQASQRAFKRMFDNPAYRSLCEDWQGFVTTHRTDEAFKERTKTDAQFMTAYSAVLDSTTVPAKRKAIRLFLEAYS